MKPITGDLHNVYEMLRQEILSGALAPGDVLNQVHIARSYGVSRTPVREALRMLEAEGLAEAQFKHRTRVTSVTSDEVDSVYATWILMQSLGVAMTIPVASAEEIAELKATLDAMNAHSPLRAGTSEEWARYHVQFHNLLVKHAGPIIQASIADCRSRSERVRRLHMRSAPQSWLDSEAEHIEVYKAFEEKSVPRAIHATSRQLARNALAVIGSIDPSYEPRALRQALKLALQTNSPGAAADMAGMDPRPPSGGYRKAAA
ncbi:GntR family transcriptional regulator [Pararobbsia silviterrae]|uniref:GntR family transcriptional regulator n=1 Tax=Pararobbsia silviterrae TaxID=1792498 RepID=A0A494YG05_9BURK|nr:GntR family transcriptional regulator [Pararobbsia silviterrae]RKP59283.1 GntR family transcriptional regulator [Pararobbsia silviterrae]